MAETDNRILTDKLVIPNEKLIFSIIGKTSVFWLQIMSYAKDNYSDITELWRFYNDGKEWLFRLIQKKKTICWIRVLPGTFRLTFYFGDKAEAFIENSDLDVLIKQDFKTTKRYGKIRGISIKVANETDVENVKKLMDIKLKLK
jgi:Protein of unknown function (DUF3788)